MDWRRRVGFNGGGYVKKKVLPQPKPKEEAEKVNKARKEKTFEKAKPALENPKEVKEMIDKPKRGLVDEPGSYAGKPKGYKISAKEQKNINAWNKRFKEAIKAGAVKPYEEQTSTVKYKIKQGQSVGFPKKPVGKFEIPLTNKQGTFYTDSYEDLGVNKKSLKNINAWEKSTGLKWYAQDNEMKKRIVRQGANIRKMSDISAEKKLKDEALEKKRIEKAKNLKTRNDKILKIINNNPGLNASQIAKRAGVEYATVTNLTNSLGIDLQKKADQLLPELKALDKLIKKNTKFLSGDASIADKRRFLFAEMQKQFGPNYGASDFIRRIQTLGNRYVGQLDQIDAYKGIKGPKNYKGSALHKNIIGLAKSDFLGVVAEARLLGLPQNQIQLLDDVLGGASKLTKMRVAGDHTDINALMKDFPNYKKNFTRINVISNRLNTEKSFADNQLIKLVRQLNNKEITPQEFTTQVEEVRTNFINKTKVPIGNPVTDARGNVSLDFQTDRLIDLKNPRNKAITQAVTNLIEQEGVKFSDFDVQYSQANTVKDRFNLLKNATTEALKKSKIIKGFAEMSGNVGEAAKNILKTKTGKVGAAGLLYTLATAAGPRPTETDLVDEVALTRGAAESIPTKTAAGAGLAAATAGTKTGRDLFSKGFKGFDRFLLRPLTAIEAPAAAVPQSAFQAGKLIGDVKRGEQTDVKGMDITLPTSLSSLAASKKFGLDLFADNAGRLKRFLRAGFTQPALRTLSRGSVFATPIIETGIQGYNAMKALQDARRNASAFEPRVDTALGEAPISYYNRIMSELPEVDRSGAAGGGIMKMAGKSSGPAPESGPTPQGLDFLMKRGR
jgi:hypothetical protein